MRFRNASRRLAALAAVLLGASACGGADEQTVDSGFWSATTRSEDERAAVAQRIRQIEVCALLPRQVLAEIGEVRWVRDIQPYSCIAELEADSGSSEAVTLGWTSTTAWEPGSLDYGEYREVGDVTVWTVADSDIPGTTIAPDARQRTCSATARFGSGAAIYLDADTPATTDPCEVVRTLVPPMLDRWRAEPGRGSSPDVRSSVLAGADPCAVRQKLADTVTEGSPQINVCAFRYRGEFVLIRFETRLSLAVTGGHTRIDVGENEVFRAELSNPDDPLRSYIAIVGPERASDEPAGYSGAEVPVVAVDAESDVVAVEVVEHVLALLN